MECYELSTVLGEGSEGKVQLAINKHTGERVAVKNFKARPGLRKDMEREAQVLKDCCEHENIISLRHYSSSLKGGNFMVYELVEGGSLQDRMKTKVSSEEIRSIMKQILTGLAWVHEKNYMHLDIKPSNILLADNNKIVKLADFGHARRVSSRICNGVVGSIPYNAPELLLGSRSYGTKADIWSAGWIFLQLLVGKDFSTSGIEQQLLVRMLDEEERERFCERKAMEKIVTWLGKPEERNWPGVSRLPNYTTLVEDCLIDDLEMKDIRSEVGNPMVVELLSKMLALDPRKRISAQEALKSVYFKQEEKKVPNLEWKPLPLTSGGVASFRPAWANKMRKPVSCDV